MATTGSQIGASGKATTSQRHRVDARSTELRQQAIVRTQTNPTTSLNFCQPLPFRDSAKQSYRPLGDFRASGAVGTEGSNASAPPAMQFNPNMRVRHWRADWSSRQFWRPASRARRSLLPPPLLVSAWYAVIEHQQPADLTRIFASPRCHDNSYGSTTSRWNDSVRLPTMSVQGLMAFGWLKDGSR